MKINIPDNVVALSPIMGRFPGKVIAQRDFLKRHGVKSAFCVPNRRGYSHYISQAGADKLERILADMLAPPPEPAAPPPPPPPAEPAPPATLESQVNTMCVVLDAVLRSISGLAADIRVLTEERADQVKKSDALTLQLGKTLNELGGAMSGMDKRMTRLLESLGETA